MKRKEDLTQQDIDAAVHGHKPYNIADSVVSGLHCRIYPTGDKSWVFRYHTYSLQCEETLGDARVLSLKSARETAVRWKNNNLIEPSAGSIRQLCDLYMQNHAGPHKRSAKEDERRFKLYILPVWGDRAITDITVADVMKLHHNIGVKYPYQANRVREQISKMFELAIDWDMVPRDWRNPARKIKDFEERSRERFITDDEMPRLRSVINAHRNPEIRAYFNLLLATGLRKQELLDLHWSHVDITNACITIPRTKNGRSHTLPLTNEALQILESLPRCGDRVFMRKFVDKAWQLMRAQAGLPDVHIHDLRRTVGSQLASKGYSLHLIGRVLNHKSLSATQVYARFQQDDLRKALNSLEQACDKVIATSPPPSQAASPELLAFKPPMRDNRKRSSLLSSPWVRKK